MAMERCLAVTDLASLQFSCSSEACEHFWTLVNEGLRVQIHLARKSLRLEAGLIPNVQLFGSGTNSVACIGGLLKMHSAGHLGCGLPQKIGMSWG